MASQEHLAMLHDDDSTTTSGDEDGETSSESGVVTETPTSLETATVTPSATEGVHSESKPKAAASAPAKKRIKLSLNAVRSKPPAQDENVSIKAENGVALEAKAMPVTSASKPDTTLKQPKSSKLPPHKAMMERASTDGTEITEDGVIKAMVVDSDDAGEDDAVAAVVEEHAQSVTSGKPIQGTDASGASTTPGAAKTQRKPANPSAKPVRLPPMSSPGLLIPPGVSGVFKATSDSTGLATPASIFDHAMSLAGYTTEGRSKRPHRGSSIRRVVGDMFDSNVKFSLHFPQLVPPELLPKTENPDDDAMVPEPIESTNGSSQASAAEDLVKALLPTKPETAKQERPVSPPNGTETSTANPKRRKLPGFREIAPLSLSIPYPEEFIQKRLEYVENVRAREKAIVDYQQEEEALEIQKEVKEAMGETVDESFSKPTTVIPDLLEPPSPPKLLEIEGFHPEEFEDSHPLYLPKKNGQQSLVAHLDKDSFHIVEGRYFGLLSNAIGDTNFFGPNAPGIAGLNFSGGTGLATANSGGGGSSGGATLLSAPSQSGASANANAPKGGSNSATGGQAASKSSVKKVIPAPAANSSTSGKSNANGKEINGDKKSVKSSTPGSPDSNGGASPAKKPKGPTPTASASELRKIMEEGDAFSEEMKTCIIRAAVFASRAGNHGRAFRAPNGKVYPDVSKAFAAYAGLKPCNRCKNNKQGAYHCRLRRKHKELDYDGADSPAVLAPLFQVAMSELVLKEPK